MTQPIEQSTVDRMVALVRDIVTGTYQATDDCTDAYGNKLPPIGIINQIGICNDARAIFELLPPPVDPDVLIAREACASVVGYEAATNYRKGIFDQATPMLAAVAALAALRKAREEGLQS